MKKIKKEELNLINYIIAVGSVDGVLTTAATIRIIDNPEVPVSFVQAFTVDKFDVTSLAPNRNIVFVDLGVNNKDNDMTRSFVDKLTTAGHKIVAIIDEHSRELWQKVFGNFDDLLIEPEDRNNYPSSGSVLRAALYDDEIDDYTVELCFAAEQGDKMNFNTHFGSIVNQAVKSNIADDSRRVYLAKHLSKNYEPDQIISEWICEYERILETHKEVLLAKVDLGNDIVRVDTIGKKVDMTTLMSELYQTGARVVIVKGEQFNPLKKMKMAMVSFGTNDKNLDLLSIFKGAGVPVGGIAQKANMEPEQGESALETLRQYLKNK